MTLASALIVMAPSPSLAYDDDDVLIIDDGEEPATKTGDDDLMGKRLLDKGLVYSLIEEEHRVVL